MQRVLYIEPFEAGSHAQFGRVLREGLADRFAWTSLTLPGRHWKWRMRGAAAYLAHTQREVLEAGYEAIWASSYLGLAELRGLVPALGCVPAVLYFHENQFGYPSRPLSETPGRAPAAANDQDYGFAQMISALAAQRLVFNSEHNRSTFLAGAEALLRRLPDAKVPGWVETMRSRSQVLGLPLELPAVETDQLCDGAVTAAERALGPIIVWNHRWEHDKGPEVFFEVLRALVEGGVAFRVAVCGERYRRVPAVFEEARGWLGARVVQWGHVSSRAAYEQLLLRSHVAVSTARHEFFGVSMLEATHLGCLALVPDALSYPELFPFDHRWCSVGELVERLRALCVGWSAGQVSLRGDRRGLTSKHGVGSRLSSYGSLVGSLVGSLAGAR